MMEQAANPRVKALAFDLYGTLLDLNSLIPPCADLFGNQGQELCRLWRAKQLEYTHLLNLMARFEDYWLVTEKALIFACHRLNLACPPALQDKLLEQFFHLGLFPDVLPALQALPGYTLAVLSSGSPKMLQVALENAGIKKFFGQIISTSEVKSYKPNPLVYQWAAQKLGLKPVEIGLVSANAWDAMGGKSCGFWVCWVNREDLPWDDLGFTPDTAVSRLTDLPDILPPD